MKTILLPVLLLIGASSCQRPIRTETTPPGFSETVQRMERRDCQQEHDPRLHTLMLESTTHKIRMQNFENDLRQAQDVLVNIDRIRILTMMDSSQTAITLDGINGKTVTLYIDRDGRVTNISPY